MSLICLHISTWIVQVCFRRGRENMECYKGSFHCFNPEKTLVTSTHNPLAINSHNSGHQKSPFDFILWKKTPSPLHGDNSMFYPITAPTQKPRISDDTQQSLYWGRYGSIKFSAFVHHIQWWKKWDNYNDHFRSERRTENTLQLLFHSNF